jgi:hypothetical protein
LGRSKQHTGIWLEKDLYYEGSTPPETAAGSADDWFKVEPEHHLLVSKARLRRCLLKGRRAAKAGPRFEHLLDLCEALLHFQHLDMLNQLKEDYEYFAPDGGKQLQASVSSKELRRRERRFLGNFLQTLVQGEFVPLGQEIYTEAAKGSYMMDVPAKVDWSAYDDELLSGFNAWVASGRESTRPLREALEHKSSLNELLSTPKEVGHNAWVFYRGIERDQVQGTFVRRKLGLLFERVVRVCLFPAVAPLEWLVRTLRGTASGGPPRHVEHAHGHEPRWIRRKNLKSGSLIGSLFGVSHLQEPALRQVVLLYRLKPEATGNERLPGRKDWTINIKTFNHIPLADSEVVFPEKIIRMRAFDVAMLIVTATLAVPALIQASRGGGAALLMVALLAAFFVRLVSSYRRVRREYAARMTRILYDKNLDNSTGVLQWLVDSLEDQELKEALLVYSILLEEGPLDRARLDARVERYLRDRFQLTVNFELEDALKKVVDRPNAPPCLLPIVDASLVDGEELFHAKPVEDALRTLDARWDALFHYTSAA